MKPYGSNRSSRTGFRTWSTLGLNPDERRLLAAGWTRTTNRWSKLNGETEAIWISPNQREFIPESQALRQISPSPTAKEEPTSTTKASAAKGGGEK